MIQRSRALKQDRYCPAELKDIFPQLFKRRAGVPRILFA
jgi:hypothetical protein